MRYTCQSEKLIETGIFTLRIMCELCTNAVAWDETGWHSSEEVELEGCKVIKLKSTQCNGLERGKTRPGWTFDRAGAGTMARCYHIPSGSIALGRTLLRIGAED